MHYGTVVCIPYELHTSRNFTQIAMSKSKGPITIQVTSFFAHISPLCDQTSQRRKLLKLWYLSHKFICSPTFRPTIPYTNLTRTNTWCSLFSTLYSLLCSQQMYQTVKVHTPWKNHRICMHKATAKVWKQTDLVYQNWTIKINPNKSKV